MIGPRLVVLGSGKGSNYVAIQRAIREGRLAASTALVISDVADAGILERARGFGVEARFLDPGRFRTRLSPEAEAAYVAAAREVRADLVILAGFMRMVKAPFLEAFPDRIVNIHPSLLPAFRGLEAWRQALDAGVAETGCTVHLVNEHLDAGRILAQARVPVLPGDTAAELHARIQEQEHRLYPAAIADYWRELGAKA